MVVKKKKAKASRIAHLKGRKRKRARVSCRELRGGGMCKNRSSMDKVLPSQGIVKERRLLKREEKEREKNSTKLEKDGFENPKNGEKLEDLS